MSAFNQAEKTPSTSALGFRHIVVLLTCFNRRQSTLDCLERVFSQNLPHGLRMDVTLVDDGSTDGTTDAVRQAFPQVRILQGDGSLYWCGGMRLAWTEAAKEDADGYLLLNDDTLLNEEAVGELTRLCGSPDAEIIAVASIVDPVTDQASYGGVLETMKLAVPEGQPRECATLNANCALVPRQVYRKLGVLHSAYTHAMGDFDYGFQARKKGIRILSSPDFIGTCPLNLNKSAWSDRSRPRVERFRALQNPKGLPWKEWVTYNRRNSGWIWPWRCVSPILRILCGR